MKAVIAIFFLLTNYLCSAQKPNWQNLDIQQDGLFGISTERAYKELLYNKTSKKLIVAVIDSGIDTAHEDLASVLWVNSNEKPANRKDDDRNGYVDDIYGWSFIGGPHGDIRYDNLEITRLVREFRNFYDSLSHFEVPEAYRAGYQGFRKMNADYENQVLQSVQTIEMDSSIEEMLEQIIHKIGASSPTLDDFINYAPASPKEEKVKKLAVVELSHGKNCTALKEKLDEMIELYKLKIKYQLNPDFDPRYIVADDYKDPSQKYYGNNNVFGPDARHGTHVAGIIGALRNNGVGMDGIADNIRIMCIRVVPDGDERDKDVANAIIYAVDNGARIINMSFAKPYSWDKKVVDNAVKYAMGKDVLIIHAAGNDAKDLDDPANNIFPNKYYADSSSQAKAWINVGASGWKDDSTLAAAFSNYGKSSVDVFAPGVQIYSTTPGSHYESLDGTSMAAPVVSGLAALIWEYFPKLTAIQVKDIIMKSVLKRDVLKDKCLSGGVVNAYDALKLAATYKD